MRPQRWVLVRQPQVRLAHGFRSNVFAGLGLV